ncbi:DMT family transporter [Paenibacillus sp. PL2-23]|uniref:DMT family transporter n=1 Tax=Paenibacillus sp. PL2-23 TaxID=2100729 RepID=UPI0030FC60B4
MDTRTFITLVLLTTFLMGVAFPVGKLGLAFAPPFFLMGLRYLLAGGLFALLGIHKPLPSGAKQWAQVAIIGLIQSTGVMGCVYYSMQWLSSSESAVLTFLSPLLVILFGSLFTGAVYQARVWIGVAVGFAGVFVTFGFHMKLNPGTWIGLLGAICFAVATLLVKHWGYAFHPQVLSAYQMLAGGIGLLALSLIAEKPYFILTLSSIVIMLFLIIMCTIVQTSVWFNLLLKNDPGRTSSFLFLAPLFGVLTSWLLLGEAIHSHIALGGVLICAGVFLVNTRGKL